MAPSKSWTSPARLAAEGWRIAADQFGAPVSGVPARSHQPFGAYATDDLARQPEAFIPVLKEVDFTV
jgi:hypothetical protein